MSTLTRQQFAAEMQVSESTVRRLEVQGLPHTVVSKRKRYDLAECKRWMREQQQCPPGSTARAAATSASWSPASAFTESYRKAHLRVMPSS